MSGRKLGIAVPPLRSGWSVKLKDVSNNEHGQFVCQIGGWRDLQGSYRRLPAITPDGHAYFAEFLSRSNPPRISGPGHKSKSAG
jgi:hypothetical protein